MVKKVNKKTAALRASGRFGYAWHAPSRRGDAIANFSIFSSGCKQPNLSTFSAAKLQKNPLPDKFIFPSYSRLKEKNHYFCQTLYVEYETTPSIFALRRAYIDYEKFQQLIVRGVIYVTKMKKSLKRPYIVKLNVAYH